MQIEIDAPCATHRIALKSSAETLIVYEEDFTWGFDPSGVGKGGLLFLSAYDSLAGKPQTPADD